LVGAATLVKKPRAKKPIQKKMGMNLLLDDITNDTFLGKRSAPQLVAKPPSATHVPLPA
jgi:hypothetical protein